MKMKRLPPKKNRFAELLVKGLSYQEAGRELGISKTTAWRWSHDPQVKELVSGLQTERLEIAHRKLLEAVDTAIETLVRLCQAESGYVAVQSARTILDLTLKLTETLEIQSRLEALEQKIRELETIKEV